MKRGFFLSLSAFIVLSFVLSSLSLKMLAVEESRSSYVELVKLSTYQTSFSSLNEESLKRLVNNSFAYAVYTVARYTAENPANSPGGLKKAIYEVFLYGQNASAEFVGGPGIDVVEQNASIVRIMQLMNESFQEQGLSITHLEYSLPEFPNTWSIEQEDYRTLKLNTHINITIEDEKGVSRINGSYDIEVLLDIEGMPDPLVNRYLLSKGLPPNRTIYFGEGEFPRLSGPIKTFDLGGKEVGQGWAYGKVLADTQFFGTFISYGKFKDVKKFPSSGYVINGTLEEHTVSCPGGDEKEERDTFNALKYVVEGSDCREEIGNALFAPVDVDGDGLREGRGSLFVNLEENKFEDFSTIRGGVEGISLLLEVRDADGNIVPAPRADKDAGDAAAMKEDAEELRVYDIEPQRQAVISGQYFPWNSQDYVEAEAPPSFLQRMVVPTHPDAEKDEEKGIFSFLITEEFKDGDNPISRVDYELAKAHRDVYVVRGFPGCKDPGMCSLKPTEYDVGRFAVGKELARDLGLARIACEWSDANEGCYR